MYHSSYAQYYKLVCISHQLTLNRITFLKTFVLFKNLYGRTQGIRRLGSASLDFCFVAMGRFEGFWEFGLQPWDICAGALILEEAGGIVTDWNNAKYPDNGIRILGTNGKIHKQMIEILNQKKYNLFY